MFANILKNTSKFFIYSAVVAPLILAGSLFFPFINGKVFLFRISTELALAFFILYLLVGKKFSSLRVIKEPMVIAVILFGLVFVLTGLLGISPYNSFWSNFERGEGGFQMLHYITFFLLLVLLFNSKQEWRRILAWNLLIVVCILLYGVMQWLEDFFGWQNFAVATGRTSGTLGNPSYLSAYLLFQFPIIIWFFASTKNRIYQTLLSVLFLFQGAVLLTTRTLAAIVSFIVGLLVLLVLYSFKIYQLSKQDVYKKFFFYWSYASSFIIVATVIGLFFFFGKIDLSQRLQPRFWTWGSAISGIMERPLLGWGSENFSQPFEKYNNPNHFGGEAWFDRTHNLVLEYLISGGVVLVFIWLLIFLFYYIKLFRMPKDNLWPVFFTVPIIYFVQGLTLFDVLPVYLAFFLFLAFFVCYANGFASSTPHPVLLPLRRGEGWLRGSLAFVVVCLILFLIYFGNYLPLRKNILLSNALRMKNLSDAVAEFSKVINFYSPVGQLESYEAIGRSLMIYIQQLVRDKVIIDGKQSNLAIIMNFNDPLFAQLKPRLVGVKTHYINAVWNLSTFKLTNDLDYFLKAKAVLQEAHAIAPKKMEIIVALLEIARAEQDQDTAQKMLATINELRPDLINQYR